MKTLLAAALAFLVSAPSFAGCQIYKAADSEEKTGFLWQGRIYKDDHSWEVTGYIADDGQTIYENDYSWNVVGFIGADKQTIYENSLSWNKIGYITFFCTEADFKRP